MQEIIFGGITISNCGALGTGIQSGVPSSLGGCVLAGWIDMSGGDKCRVRGCEAVEKRKKKGKKVESPNETLRFSHEREGWITHPAGGVYVPSMHILYSEIGSCSTRDLCP